MNDLKFMTLSIYISIEIEAQWNHKNKMNEALKDLKIQTLHSAIPRANS